MNAYYAGIPVFSVLIGALLYWLLWPRTKERRLLHRLKKTLLAECRYDDIGEESLVLPGYVINCPEGFGARRARFLVYSMDCRGGTDDFIMQFHDERSDAVDEEDAKVQERILEIVYLRLSALGHPAFRREAVR